MRQANLKIYLVVISWFLFLPVFAYPDQVFGWDIIPASEAVVGGAENIEEFSFSNIAENAAEHIVNISTKRIVNRSPFAMNRKQQSYTNSTAVEIQSSDLESSLGSGVLISNDGIVVTNFHVIENAIEIHATSTTKRQFPVTVLGVDPSTDLAVVRLEGKFDNLKPIPFGDSDRVRVGDMVLAAGNPYALNRSVSMGIVSALQRADFGEVEYENFIQTDAAINPGNSGGALINMRGDLIGINSSILSQSGGNVGIGFAIPSNLVREVTMRILKDGKVVHSTLGVAIQKVDQDIIDAFQLPSDKGVIITNVSAGSPAERAGLKSGDVVLMVNNDEIVRNNQFRNIVAFTNPGTVIHLTVYRQGKTMKLDAAVREKPQKQKTAPELVHPKPGGLTVTDLTADLRRQIGVPNEIPGKVVVMEVDPSSAAGMSGFSAGDIILEMNSKPVNSLSEYKDLYQSQKGNIVFLVRRPEGFLFRLLRNQP